MTDGSGLSWSPAIGREPLDVVILGPGPGRPCRDGFRGAPRKSPAFPAGQRALWVARMIRPLSLILILVLCACASPRAPVPAASDEGAELPDPRIRPLSTEMEELAK